MSQRIYNPLIVLVVFAVAAMVQLRERQQTSEVGRHPAVQRYVFPTLGARLDSQIHDIFFRARNAFFEQSLASEVTVVGIDDRSTEELGRLNTGRWVTREPYREQLRNFSVLRPSVIAYDLLFADFRGNEDHEKEALTYNAEAIAEIQKSLAALDQSASIEESRILLNMSALANELGDFNLASALSLAFQPDAPPEKRITTILGYAFPDRPDAKWNTAQLLGDDEEDLAEDYGLEMPYLRDVHIPLEHVTGGESYPWYEYAVNLPTNLFLDYGRLGYINVPRDEDGIVRRVPMVIGISYSFTDPETKKEVERKFMLPSMSLLACLSHWGIDLTALHADEQFVRDGKPAVEVILGEVIRVHKPNGETVEIPVDKQGRLLLNFVGQLNDFNNLSFAASIAYPAEVFQSNPDDLPPEIQEAMKRDEQKIRRTRELIHRKLLMIGLTGTGMSDVGPCPINTNTPFVHMHVMAASNILTGTYLRAASPQVQFRILLIACLLTMLGSALLRPIRMGYAVLLAGAAYLIWTFSAVVVHWQQLPVMVPLGAIAVAYLILVFIHYLTEARDKMRIRGMFSTMVSGDVLDYMETNPDSFSLGGERRDASIFFSDLAGFTTISENLPADKLVDLLNEYLSPMTEIIMDSQGFVDKYIGDAIMAVWGVPYPNPDHARLACWSALDQQAKINELGARFKEEYGVDVLVRMGINSGTIVAGNMGSTSRLSYTVMGDAVNQAARYEPANKDYDTLIMIGESTFQLAKEHIECRLLDRIVVKGKSVPIQVYELLAKKGELDDVKTKVVGLYHQALEVHWNRDWERAIELLDDALTIDPDDGPCQAMRERIEGYREVPPPDSWQGEFVRTKK